MKSDGWLQGRPTKRGSVWHLRRVDQTTGPGGRPRRPSGGCGKEWTDEH